MVYIPMKILLYWRLSPIDGKNDILYKVDYPVILSRLFIVIEYYTSQIIDSQSVI